MPTTTTKTAIPMPARVVNALKMLRGMVAPDLGVQHLLVLLYVYQTPGVSLLHLEKELGISNSSASRIVQRLGEGSHSQSIKGLGLTKVVDDPMNLRSKLVSLTSKGQATAASFINLLEG